jgi:exopolysaccharide biosynthesis protein
MLDQIGKCEVRAAILARHGLRQAQGIGGLLAIVGKGLHHFGASVSHVADAHLHGIGQRPDERLQLGQLDAEAGRARGIVQENEKLHARHAI